VAVVVALEVLERMEHRLPAGTEALEQRILLVLA
jgi:hypothetical protein